MTFFEVYDLWLDEHKAEVKQTTFVAYRYARKTFAKVMALPILSVDERHGY